jgi:hypothetical protein
MVPVSGAPAPSRNRRKWSCPKKDRKEEKQQRQHDKDAQDERDIQALKDRNARALEREKRRRENGE